MKAGILAFVLVISAFGNIAAPQKASAATSVTDCPLLRGDSKTITSTYVDKGGISHDNDNSGQNFFSGFQPSKNGKPVYVAPTENAACAQKIDNTIYLKGWFWNDNIGWINLYCSGLGYTARGIDCGNQKYGVTIDSSGYWHGYAWSSVGWIRFSCETTPEYNDVDYCAKSNFKVRNVSAGTTPDISIVLSPNTYAWSDSVGWMVMFGIVVPLDELVKIDDPIDCPTDPKGCKVIEESCALNPTDPLCSTLIDNPVGCARDPIVPCTVVDPANPGGGGPTPDQLLANPGGSSDSSGTLNCENTPELPGCTLPPDPCIDDPALPACKIVPLICPGSSCTDDFSVTWNTAKPIGNTADSSTGTTLNPVTPANVRNTIYKNVLKWKKVASTSCGVNGGYLTQFSTSDQVFYCTGDVILNGSLANWKGNKTIIVDGGNVFIENSLYSDTAQLGIIVLRKSMSNAATGNVYIGGKVRELRTQIYADGLVLPAKDISGTPPTISDYGINGDFFGQLYIRGTIISGNISKYKYQDGAVPLKDLASLRSIPANPAPQAQSTKSGAAPTPLLWKEYAGAVKSGTIEWNDNGKIKDSKASAPNTTTDGSDENPNGTAAEKKKTVTKVDEKVVKAKQIDIKKIDTSTYNSGVFMQFEPPVSTLGGFEGALGNSYRQTK